MKRCVFRLFFFLASVGFALLNAQGYAADQSYLDRLPPVEQVLADHQGIDRADTLARQEAALNQLTHAISLLSRGSESPDPQRKRGEYGSAARKLHSEALSMHSNEKSGSMPWSKSPRDEWRGKQGAYERDPKFRAATFERYIPAEVRPQLEAESADFEARFYGERSSGTNHYDQASPAVKIAAQIIAYGLLLWMALILVREFRRFGARPSNPLLIDAGFRLYRVQWATGTVTDYSSWTETVKTKTTETDPYGNTRTTMFQRTYLHESFTLASSRGDHHVHIIDGKVYPIVGHVLTAVWAVRHFRKGGHYVLFFDRTAPKTTAIEITIRWLLSLRLVMFIPIIALAAIGGWTATLLLNPSPNDRPAILFGTIIVAMIVAALLFVQTNKRRGRRFIRNDASCILTAIEKAEPPDAGLLVTQSGA
jgi:hypothetical protein